MRIRMQGNSLRLRVGQRELARFLECGRIEETIRFAATPEARFTCALELSAPESTTTSVRYALWDLTVLITPEQLRRWQKKEEVGIYTQVDIGTGKALEIIVEKDFACLDGNDGEDADTLPNPHLAENCQVASSPAAR